MPTEEKAIPADVSTIPDDRKPFRGFGTHDSFERDEIPDDRIAIPRFVHAFGSIRNEITKDRNVIGRLLDAILALLDAIARYLDAIVALLDAIARFLDAIVALLVDIARYLDAIVALLVDIARFLDAIVALLVDIARYLDAIVTLLVDIARFLHAIVTLLEDIARFLDAIVTLLVDMARFLDAIVTLLEDIARFLHAIVAPRLFMSFRGRARGRAGLEGFLGRRGGLGMTCKAGRGGPLPASAHLPSESRSIQPSRRLSKEPPSLGAPVRKLAAASLFALLAAVTTSPSPAHADEGMWPFNMVPKEQIQKDHGVTLTDAWLDHVRLSSVRFNSGGSGSFVSSTGLVLTNHHVASDCIAKIATAQKDYLETGYVAGTDGPEVKCPDLELNQLVAIEDVTDKVKAARQPGMTDADANVAMKGEMSKIEKFCADSHPGNDTRCDVVTLYAGGKYQLYTYAKYKDVRLVFAPEQKIAFFGGDPDNFTYPRYDLDLAIFRVYQNDKAVQPKDYLKWSPTGPKDGDTVFVSGHPGKTDRMDTMGQLTRMRDLLFPYYLDQANRERSGLRAFAQGNAEGEREIRHAIFRLENGIKAITGEAAGLHDAALMKKKGDDEAALRSAVKADPKLAVAYGTAWDDVEHAQSIYAAIYKRYAGLERGANRSELFGIARTLVRLPHELALPNATRLREYRDSGLDSLKFELFSSAPIYGGEEAVVLKTWLDRVVRDLGAKDPLVKEMLAGRTTAAAAAEIVAGTQLTDPYVRHALFDGGAQAIAASTDPLIQLIKLIDLDARAIRKQYEDEVEGPMRQAGQKIAQASFAVRGTGVYPDATFTLRLSPGVVKGYREGGKTIPWATDFGGMYKHATGNEPLKLPPRWVTAKGSLNPATPLDFVSTNDIIGGNSGSPVVDASGNLVGLIFDGNITSLPNAFVYSETTARAVSVDTAGMLEALAKVFGASTLVAELTGATPGK